MSSPLAVGDRVRILDPTLVFHQLMQAPIFAERVAANATVDGFMPSLGLIWVRSDWEDRRVAVLPYLLEAR